MHSLPAIYGRQHLVRQVDDAHLLIVRERLVVAHDERLPEVAAEKDVAEPSAFQCRGSATGS